MNFDDAISKAAQDVSPEQRRAIQSDVVTHAFAKVLWEDFHDENAREQMEDIERKYLYENPSHLSQQTH